MQRVFDGKPKFWLFQLSGWTAYGIILALSTIPVATEKSAIAYRLVLFATTFAASFVMHVVCRRQWRGGFAFPRSLVKVLAWCAGLACLCSAIAIKFEYGVAGEQVSLIRTLAGAPSAGFILLSWSALYFGIKYYLAVEAERHRALSAEKLVRDAELRALRYQVHPHFLFNTLNAISTLVIEGQTEGATAMISRLAEFFRATLQEQTAEEVEFQDELFLTEQYLEIERLRLGDRLIIKIEVPPDLLVCRVPHLVLQPLVENAIRHGIAPRLGPGRVGIEAHKDSNNLIVTVTDDGLGNQSRNGSKDEDGRGIGLSNVDKRLRELYGDSASLELRWPASGGCQAVLQIPYFANWQGRTVNEI